MHIDRIRSRDMHLRRAMIDVVECPDLNKKSEFILYPKMTLAIKLDLHELEGEGLRVEQVVEITETGARPLNKLAMKVKDDWAIL